MNRRAISAAGKRQPARARHRFGDERGQAGFTMLVFFPTLMVLGLLGMDIAMMLGSRVSVQRAADAAALAGCQDLDGTANPAGLTADVAKYGASSGGLNATAAVNLDSGDGNQAATATVSSSGANGASGQPLANDRLRVDVSRSQPLIGLPAYGFVNQTIKAYAICQRSEGTLPDLVALGSGPNSFTCCGGTQQNPALQLGGSGGLVVNSTDPNALTITNGSDITGSSIITGSGKICGGASCPGSATPPVSQGTVQDPYGGVAEPAVPASNGSCSTAGGVTTCTPGKYTSNLTLSGNVTLQAGIYYLVNANLTVSANATVTGSGAMIFSKCGSTTINQNANFNVSPAQSGTYAGLIYFQGRTCPQTLTIQAGVSMNPTNAGVFYLPAGRLDVRPDNGNLRNINAAFIASTMNFSGAMQWDGPSIHSGNVTNGDIALVQ